jgi:hypothetical protein
VGTQQRQRGPGTLQDVLREEAEATVTEAHGRWGQAIDVCAVQAGALQLLCRDAVGGCVVELREQADCPDIGWLGTLARAAELQCRNHLLMQWGHERSPCVS